jgi:DNA-binding HxlR family transcriptional regulator
VGTRRASAVADARRCPVEITLGFIAGRWKPAILWELRGGRRRYTELLASVPGISHQVLTRQLRQLERDGIVTRTVQAGAARHVEYALSPFGRTLRPSLNALAGWAKAHHARALMARAT